MFAAVARPEWLAALKPVQNTLDVHDPIINPPARLPQDDVVGVAAFGFRDGGGRCLVHARNLIPSGSNKATLLEQGHAPHNLDVGFLLAACQPSREVPTKIWNDGWSKRKNVATTRCGWIVFRRAFWKRSREFEKNWNPATDLPHWGQRAVTFPATSARKSRNSRNSAASTASGSDWTPGTRGTCSWQQDQPER